MAAKADGLNLSLDELVQEGRKKKQASRKKEKNTNNKRERERDQRKKSSSSGNTASGDLRDRLGPRRGRVEKGGRGRDHYGSHHGTRGRGRGRGFGASSDRRAAKRDDGGEEDKESNNYPETCEYDAEAKELVVHYESVALVKIDASGNMTLSTGGNQNQEYLDVINRILKPIQYKVTRQGEGDQETWSVTDGRSILRFSDDIVIPPKGPLSKQRGEKIALAYKCIDPPNSGYGGYGGYGGRGRGRGRGRGWYGGGGSYSRGRPYQRY